MGAGCVQPALFPALFLPHRTFCLIFLCVELAVTFMLGVAVLYASYYDREFFYHLLLQVLPEDIFTDLAHFLEETPSLVSEGVLPH